MVAKKDILDRLDSPGTASRSSAAGGASDSTRKETRVSRGVIRRRRRPAKADAPSAPPALPTGGLGAVPEAPVEAKAEPEAEVPAATEPVAVEPEAVAPAEEEVAPVEAAEPEVVADEPAEEAPVEAAKEEAVADTAAEAVEVAEAPAAEAESEQAAAEEAAEEPASPEGGTPSAALPTLGDRKKPDAATAFPGLGSAVIAPPPDYDPNDPTAHKRRAAADAAAAEAAAAAPRNRWGGSAGAAGAGRRRGGSAEEEEKARTQRTRRNKSRRGGGRIEMFMDEMPHASRRRRRRGSSGPKKASPPPKAQKRRVQVDGEISVGQLAQEMSLKATQLIRKLLELGSPATINAMIDVETAQMLASEFEWEVIDTSFREEEHMIQIDSEEDDAAAVTRPPVVTVMGHVDHGKTTLLDTIRNAAVVDTESGGITQHIGAYQVERNDQLMTFIDTPGHEAFTEMRARGAAATDIAILVVAADDGVMPQTIESISHARAADVPIIVAVNKCDKPGVKPEVIRQRLMEHELIAEEFGGDIQMVNVSALKGEGIEDLLEAVLLQAEMLELRANPDRAAEGVILEARVEKGRGTVATLLVSAGTLESGQSYVVGTTSGRVRAMSDYRGNRIKSAGPSTPVELIGLSGVPAAGDSFVVVKDDRAARALADHRAEQIRARQGGAVKLTLEEIFARSQANELITLNLIVKADVQGSLEALCQSLQKLEVPTTQVRILHKGVGQVSESDVQLARGNEGIIIGFHVTADGKARALATQSGVDIRMYNIIYEAIEEVQSALVGMLAPVTQEVTEGQAEVRELFRVPRLGIIAGSFVQQGRIVRNGSARLMRAGELIWEGQIGSLKRFKDDVREVQNNFECGIGLDGCELIEVGDVIECYTIQEVAPSIEGLQ